MLQVLRHNVNLPMDAAYLEFYNEVETATIPKERMPRKWMEKNITKFMNGMRRAMNERPPEYRDECPPSPKVVWFKKSLEEWGVVGERASRDVKIAIFTQFLEYGKETIGQVLQELKVTYVAVDGDTARPQDEFDKFNEGAVQAIIFTAAAAEGTTLKGTRHVIVLEPPWHHAGLEQAIARGARLHSHSHLPPAQRTLDVHCLRLLKPQGELRSQAGRRILLQSADEILYAMVQRKGEVWQKVVCPLLTGAEPA